MTKTPTRLVASLTSAARGSLAYLLIELLLPGGTLIALLLFLYERRSSFATTHPARRNLVVARSFATLDTRRDSVVRTLRSRHPAPPGSEHHAIDALAWPRAA